MKTIIIIALILLAYSCSRVNQESRDHYNAKKIRHGIVPLSQNVVQKLSKESVKRGEAIYRQHCLACHGKNGEGNGPLASRNPGPANLRKLAREVRNFNFFMSISQWQGDMPGWKQPFTSSERDDLVAYIKSLR